MTLSFKVESTNKRFDASSWVQVYEFGPQDEETKKHKGYLICAIEVIVKDKDNLIEPSNYAKKTLNTLHQYYYGVSDKSAYESLASSLRNLSVYGLNDAYEINLSCLVVVEEVVYVGVVGRARSSIIRNGGLAHILVGTNVSAVASGRPVDGDIMILSIGSEDVINSSEANSILTSTSIYKANVELGQLLDSKGETYALGLVRFGDESNYRTEANSNTEVSASDSKIKRPSNPFKHISQKLTERKIKIKSSDEEIPKQKKSILIVGVIIIGLLIVSIAFGMIQKNNIDNVAKYSDRLSKAESDYQSAIDLYNVSLNESRSKFIESKQLSGELVSEGVVDDRLTNLLNKISQNEGKITGNYQVEPELYVDLSLLSDDFGGKEISTGETQMYVLSSAGDRVASVEFPSKRSEIVVGPQDVKGADKIANFNEDVFYVNNDGLYNASKKEKIKDKYWEGEALLYSYGGNIYLLDKANSIIYRHSATDGGYADPSEWTKEDDSRDLSKISAWSIDGLVWLLSSSGKIAKYSQGVEQNFNISELTSGFTNPVDIYTNENIDNLYVLDPTNSSVVVITKDGDHVASYTDQTLGSAKKISVSESDKLMFILLEGKVYSLELRHLENL